MINRMSDTKAYELATSTKGNHRANRMDKNVDQTAGPGWIADMAALTRATQHDKILDATANGQNDKIFDDYQSTQLTPGTEKLIEVRQLPKNKVANRKRARQNHHSTASLRQPKQRENVKASTPDPDELSSFEHP
ncbi:hypothetical protein R1flu_024134 [Riccia fluitans]|uniref:Uncharacterized protein n=1 Tax=Riccia fluitans TaxID=41844 RepID=A0ABD1XU06_9MARC